MWSSYPEYLFLINTLTAALFGPLCPYFLSPSLHDYLHPFVFNSFSLSPSFHWPLHSLHVLYPQIPLSVQVDEANSPTPQQPLPRISLFIEVRSFIEEATPFPCMYSLFPPYFSSSLLFQLSKVYICMSLCVNKSLSLSLSLGCVCMCVRVCVYVCACACVCMRVCV